MKSDFVEKNINSVASSFQFDSYIINNVEFKLNDDFEPSESVNLDFNLHTDFVLNETENKAIVSLECVVFKDYLEENFPFFLNVEIIGNFTLEGDFTQGEIADLCRINATAILFPYLRAFISNMTSLAGVPNLILPTVNVTELLKK